MRNALIVFQTGKLFYAGGAKPGLVLSVSWYLSTCSWAKT